MLLQILDDGILTDSQGRKVDFRNTVIIMTSNLGAKLIAGENSSIGFTKSALTDDERISQAVTGELKKAFRPEFLNRIDEIIIFKQLKKDEIRQIASNMLKNLKTRLSDLEIDIDFSDSTVDFVSDKGFDPLYGARPLRRTIQTKIEDILSEKILDGSMEKGKKYLCEVKDGKISVEEAA